MDGGRAEALAPATAKESQNAPRRIFSMSAQELRITDLRDDLAFGSRIWGATHDNLRDPEVRRRLNRTFEDRGLLVFEGVEQSCEMQLAISDVFGPLKDHPVAQVARTAEDLAPGIIDLTCAPDHDTTVVELDGKIIHNWLPWHFDHSYNNELNRAGVLRAVVVAPEGGLTGFADGIELYDRMPPELRDRIEGKSVIYTLDLLIEHMRFGKPPGLREIKTAKVAVELAEVAKAKPRAIHPAVWTRASGEKVLHVGALHSVGVEGHEDPAGDALLEQVCEYVAANPNAYFHRWSLGQMLIWDNWRILHCVTGADARYPRRMHRTTIRGDYGLGRFENEAAAGKAPERTV
jgi:taurine dioxygenase